MSGCKHPKGKGNIIIAMKYILFLFLLLGTTLGFAQMPATVPVVPGKKISSIAIFGIGYDSAGVASPRQLLTQCKFDEDAHCINRDYYYPIAYPSANPDGPKSSEYQFRSKQKPAFIKTLQTYDEKGRLIKVTNVDSDGNKTVSHATFNDKGQETKIVSKTKQFTNTTYKKYDVAGNLVSTRVYENDKLLINVDNDVAGNPISTGVHENDKLLISIDSTVYNSKNLKVLDYRWDNYHTDHIYYTYHSTDSIASQYWVVTQADNPGKKDTSNIILYEYDDKGRHVHTLEYINVTGINDLHAIEYQYSPDGGYSVWFRNDDRVTLTKTYDAQQKPVIQIENPNTVASVTKKYYHTPDGLLGRIDIYNSANKLIDKEEYDYTFW